MQVVTAPIGKGLSLCLQTSLCRRARFASGFGPGPFSSQSDRPMTDTDTDDATPAARAGGGKAVACQHKRFTFETDDWSKAECWNCRTKGSIQFVPKHEPARSSVERALLQSVEDLLAYAEDVLSNKEQLACFKPGVVQAHVKAAHDAIEAAALAAAPATGATLAVQDVLAERQRQITGEGWTPEHDEQHREGELCLAAAGYARATSDVLQAIAHEFDAPGEPTLSDPVTWSYGLPWPVGWDFKPAPPRRQLVKAGALILAEIERMDRATVAPTAGGAA